MRLSEYASTQRTYGSRKVPRSVQQSIPIDRIYEDGTWCCGNVYSQMWSMPDINFTMSDEDNKAKILNLLGKVYIKKRRAEARLRISGSLVLSDIVFQITQTRFVVVNKRLRVFCIRKADNIAVLGLVCVFDLLFISIFS